MYLCKTNVIFKISQIKMTQERKIGKHFPYEY
jgi:hypothetical protein